ncbi:T9SS type A sorting domain-containing protein [Flavobacterium sp. 25HG05S-40]|uniref:T9SS type A sorting domain-containing protein n=1 Tax=Flavobacterium sp. 25HG05S-40 TaxID=3458682 RepID=UPI004044D58D
MKTKLLLACSLLYINFATAQCGGGVPPPPGLNDVYALDIDNDGYATFDIAYYIANVDRPKQEIIYGVSSSGYDFIFQDTTGTVLPLQYTNTSDLEAYYVIAHVYSGSGPTFDPQPPCYWPVYESSVLKLVPVSYNLDMDGDGILNVDEDTNRNTNLMDDDDDQDGIINLKDTQNLLAVAEVNTLTLSIYPNPVTQGSLTFASDVEITKITLFDISGKDLGALPFFANTIALDAMANGIYFLQFHSENNSTIRKIVISR